MQIPENVVRQGVARQCSATGLLAVGPLSPEGVGESLILSLGHPAFHMQCVSPSRLRAAILIREVLHGGRCRRGRSEIRDFGSQLLMFALLL